MSTPAYALTAPAGTKVYNVWIWLVIFVPYLTLPFLFTFDLAGYVADMVNSTSAASVGVELQMMTSPAFLLLSLGGWITSAAAVLFSWLDWRWLTAAGVPKPFHWAYGFISLAGYPVYAIGRAVVTRRRTGQGIAVMWVTIAALVVSFLIAIVWSVALMASILSQFNFS